MKLSITLPTMVPGVGREALRDWCERVDAGPFESLAVGERVTYPNLEIGVALAAAAAWTERVRIVATVFVAPLHPAAELAKRIASLDVVSGGRLVAGLGVGGREEDYRALGVPFGRRHARLDALVAEMRRLWAGEPAYPGAAPVGPGPVQSGGPPLWIGAAGPRAIARAAAWADGIAGFSLGPDPEEIARVFRAAERAWREAGRSAPPVRATSFWIALGPGARDRLDEYVGRYLGVFGSDAVAVLRPRCRAAGAEAVRAALRAARDAGTDELFVVPTSADPGEIEALLDVWPSL